MPFRFTKADIISGSIVQSREFDNALGNYVDVLNGSLDRDNIPYLGVTSPSCKSGLFQKVKIVSNLNANDADLLPDTNYVTPTPNRLGRLMYGFRYEDGSVGAGGGWQVATTQTIDCEEGMLTIDWGCAEAKTQYWSYWKDHSSAVVALKWGSWQIRVDGNSVYTGAAQFEIMQNSIHRCTIPISKGTHSISVHWYVPLQRDDDSQEQAIFVWWGGQLTMINKYR